MIGSIRGDVKLGKQVCWDDVKHAREKGVWFSPGVLPAVLEAGSCQEEVELEGEPRAFCQVKED